MTIPNISDQSEIKRLLVHYKKFYISFGIIMLCGILFFTFIVPQIQQYSEARAQIQEVQNRIIILQKNISFLSSLDDSEQNAQLTTVLAALPEDKDYAGILLAVRSASSKAGVGIGDFTFQVGELSAKSIITRTLPTVSMHLNVLGTPNTVEKFLIEISQTLPLSNITEVSIKSEGEDMTMAFNARYLLDYLSVVSDEEVDWETEGELKPSVFRSGEKSLWFQVIMPIRA
jgi:hypothetical protein